jgi:4-hydroxybenzoate polyprenyltransferase
VLLVFKQIHSSVLLLARPVVATSAQDQNWAELLHLVAIAFPSMILDLRFFCIASGMVFDILIEQTIDKRLPTGAKFQKIDENFISVPNRNQILVNS